MDKLHLIDICVTLLLIDAISSAIEINWNKVQIYHLIKKIAKQGYWYRVTSDLSLEKGQKTPELSGLGDKFPIHTQWQKQISHGCDSYQ